MFIQPEEELPRERKIGRGTVTGEEIEGHRYAHRPKFIVSFTNPL
jgi:hypothetical protein